MESVIIWESLEACQFPDCNNPPALFRGVSTLYLQMEDAGLPISMLTQIRSASGLVYSPHIWVENPGLLCSGLNIGNNCMKVVVFVKTSIWS